MPKKKKLPKVGRWGRCARAISWQTCRWDSLPGSRVGVGGGGGGGRAPPETHLDFLPTGAAVDLLAAAVERRKWSVGMNISPPAAFHPLEEEGDGGMSKYGSARRVSCITIRRERAAQDSPILSCRPPRRPANPCPIKSDFKTGPSSWSETKGRALVAHSPY